MACLGPPRASLPPHAAAAACIGTRGPWCCSRGMGPRACASAPTSQACGPMLARTRPRLMRRRGRPHAPQIRRALWLNCRRPLLCRQGPPRSSVFHNTLSCSAIPLLAPRRCPAAYERPPPHRVPFLPAGARPEGRQRSPPAVLPSGLGPRPAGGKAGWRPGSGAAGPCWPGGPASTFWGRGHLLHSRGVRSKGWGKSTPSRLFFSRVELGAALLTLQTLTPAPRHARHAQRRPRARAGAGPWLPSTQASPTALKTRSVDTAHARTRAASAPARTAHGASPLARSTSPLRWRVGERRGLTRCVGRLPRESNPH
jgi:hypothetical protein